MNKDLNQARTVLSQGGFTCVLCRGGIILTSSARGIAPLLAFLEEGQWSGFSAADKVVGKATAFLYVLMDVRAVYAPVMSKAAARILTDHGVECVYETIVDAVFNRSRTGYCPMEPAVRDIEDPGLALAAIRQTLTLLQK